MKYTVHVAEDEESNFFHVVYEKATDQIIEYFFFEDEAADYALFLNKGGAFDGFTPPFILKEIMFPKDKETINNQFEKYLGE